MTLFQDISIADSGDIDLSTNDFSIVASDQQHILDIIMTFQNEWKQYPAIGVGLPAYFKTSNQEQTIQRNVIVQLTSDGYTVTNPKVLQDTSGHMTVVPNAVRQK